MAGTREARRQVEAVVREWCFSMGVRDMGRRASLWDQEYPQPIFIFEDADDPLLEWSAIWEYYEQMPALDWSLEGLSANVIGDLAHAFCSFSVKADIDRERPGFYVREPTTRARLFNGRITFILRNRRGVWKIIHYHESLSRDHSYQAWSYLWN